VRCWRLPNGDTLEEREHASATAFHLEKGGRITLRDGTFVEPRTFELLDPAGKPKRYFGDPHTSPLDDYLYVLDVHFVRAGVLLVRDARNRRSARALWVSFEHGTPPDRGARRDPSHAKRCGVICRT
jgi:hypothetical protein